MSDTVRVRVAGRAFRVGGESYAEGDELEIDESIADRHPNTLEVLDDSGSESDDGDGDSPDDPLPGIDEDDSLIGETSDESQSTDESADETEDEDAEICGVEMADGSICERPADECPYHG